MSYIILVCLMASQGRVVETIVKVTMIEERQILSGFVYGVDQLYYLSVEVVK